ncbi:MAG: cyclic nucleotide-binding domain-containing protein [Deltaproteobacteria bacterium]|nr:cyclic nucleotide-binding domain-containing protein [Deltaproteobacteria bacterium]
MSPYDGAPRSPTRAPTIAGATPRLLSCIPGLDQLSTEALTDIAGRLSERVLEANTVLVEQGEQGDGLYVLTRGEVAVYMRGPDGERFVSSVRAPALLGEVHALVGGQRSATVRARGRVTVERLGQEDFEVLVRAYPALLDAMAELSRERLRHQQACRAMREALGPLPDELVEEFVARLHPLRLGRGQPLFEAGDAGDRWYLVRTGALKVHRGEMLINELGPGDALGALALVTRRPRAASVTALDSSELLALDRDDFFELLERCPHGLVAGIASLAIDNLDRRSRHRPVAHTRIAVLGAAPQLDVATFCRQLGDALAVLGPSEVCTVRSLTELGLSGSPTEDFGPQHPSWLRMQLWLEAKAEAHEVVILAVDPRDDGWARFAADWANHLVVLGHADAGPRPSELERVMADEITGRHTLVLAHPPKTAVPKGTRAWLDPREVSQHVNIRLGDASHMSRLARLLVGRGVTVVLGGGGARGMAHLGVFRALEAARVPVDAIVGVSVGAFVGGALAQERTVDELVEFGRSKVAGAKLARPTLPLISLLSSAILRQLSTSVFGDDDIADTWRPFVCTSASLTRRTQRIHQRGSIVEATLASSAVPGFAPPVASDGELLVDGGVLNNVPADVARSIFGGTVIAVDVGGRMDLSYDGPGMPSPWQVLWSKLLPWRKPLAVPNLALLICSAMNLGADAQTERAMGQADLLIRPDVKELGPGDTGRFMEVVDQGAAAGHGSLAEWTAPDPAALAGSSIAPRSSTR